MSEERQESPAATPADLRPLRIGMVIDAWDDANNGGVVSTRRFTDLLRARGHTVEILATGNPAPGKIPLKSWVIPTPGNIMERMRLPFAWPDAKILGEVIPRQDVIHSHFPFWLGIKAARLAREGSIDFSTMMVHTTQRVAGHNLHRRHQCGHPHCH